VPGAPAAPRSDVVLRDGSTVAIRSVEPEDLDGLRALLAGLTPEARRLRFFSGGADVQGAARRAATVGLRDAAGLVALAGDPQEIVGHACFERGAPDVAEVAFEVSARMRGQGLATILLAHLAEVAAERGIERFVAEVLPENRRMIEVFRESGFPTELKRGPDDLRVSFPTGFTAEVLERYASRDRVAAAAAARHFLEPRSVAVVGASRKARTVGARVLRNLLRSGFDGPIYPVNRSAGRVQGRAAFGSVGDLPETPELVVVATPAQTAADVARDCAVAGVPALLVLSAGFAEAGAAGVRREADLLTICRAAGMRLMGPNCLGVMGAARPIDATFSPHSAPLGRVGLLSQSGGVGLALIEQCSWLGLGLSSFASIGNRPDLSANDLLEYWEQDDSTQVVLLYLESFGNPRNFARLARRLSRRKPVVAVSAGSSKAGTRAAASHTGSVIAASELGVDALFRHAGIMRVETIGDLFETAVLMSSQPLPAGRRVGIVTNSGGPAILCADACHAASLEVPELSGRLQESLAGLLPPHAGTGNPVDMLAAAGSAEFSNAVGELARSGEVDAVIAIFTPALESAEREVRMALAEAARESDLPVVAVLFGEEGGRAEQDLPVYRYPEGAARALGRAAGHAAWLADPSGELPAFPDAGRDEAAELLASAVEAGPRWLAPGEVSKLLGLWRIPTVAAVEASGPAAAGRAAEELGGTVVVKGVAEGLVHKSDLGAVELALSGAHEAACAARRIARRLRAHGYVPNGFLVQREAEPGVEMLAGISVEPGVGPLVACAAGGTAVELMNDVAVSVAPLTDLDAGRMIRSLKTFPLLDGYRGARKLDVAALEQVLQKLGAMADAHPELAELDCNPLVVGPHDALVVDARVRVVPPPPRMPWPALGADPPAI
jgi:acyl-CoA synthetase (NDP forming)/GNAT superfamily N-acetyltransferase